MIQIALATVVVLLACGGLGWWLYHRETALSRERRHAELRAQALAQHLLTADELKQLRGAGFLELKSGMTAGRTYVVPRQRGQVQVYQDGRHTGSLCIQPIRWVPDLDVVIMHKMMIEGSEETYLRIANFFKPYRIV